MFYALILQLAFPGEIALWAHWKHVGSARAVYEQLGHKKL